MVQAAAAVSVFPAAVLSVAVSVFASAALSLAVFAVPVLADVAFVFAAASEVLPLPPPQSLSWSMKRVANL